MAKKLPPSELEPEKTDVSASVDSKPKIERLSSMPLRLDGSIDVESMRDTTKDKLRSVLPRLAADLGTDVPAGPSLGSAEFTFLSHAVIELLGSIEGVILIKVAGASPDVARSVGQYTDRERDIVTPPMSKLLAKYGGTLLGKYGDETALALTLYSITQAKIAAAKSIMADRAKTPAAPPADTPNPKPGPALRPTDPIDHADIQ